MTPFQRVRRSYPPAQLSASPYEFASNELLDWATAGHPEPILRVIHGAIQNAKLHAWVERGAYAYDSTMIGQSNYFGEGPITIAAYRRRHLAKPHVVYTHAHEVLRLMTKHGHHGPWHQPLAVFLFNGIPLSEDIEDFLVLNYDSFTDEQRERIRNLEPRERIDGRDWAIERAL